MILVGIPKLILDEEIGVNGLAPVLRRDLYRNVLAQETYIEDIQRKIRQEYVSVVKSLISMGMDFRIIYSHGEEQDNAAIMECLKMKDKDLLFTFDTDDQAFSIYSPGLLSVSINGVILINEFAGLLHKHVKPAKNILVSYYGSSAQTIADGNNIFVAERRTKGRRFAWPRKREIAAIEKRNLKVNFFPVLANRNYFFDEGRDVIYPDDSFDSSMAMISDAYGRDFLLVDSKAKGVVLDEDRKENKLLSPRETISLIKKTVSCAGITVVPVKEINVPHSLCLQQFKDGRILMTKGEIEVENVLKEIIGEDHVVTTDIPIRYYPAWFNIGIKCLVGDVPKELLM